MEYPKNQLDALTQALVLAVTASTEEKSRAALELADGFAQGLNDIEVAQCKRRAEAIVKASEP